MARSEWKESLIAQWNAERESRPTEKERSYWPTTISELRMKLAIEGDRSLKCDLYHRLTTALVKIEDYSSALEVVEEGLGQGIEGWNDLLLMDKAEVLYLMGREKEAFVLVEKMTPPEEGKVVEESTSSVPTDIGTEVRLLCPDCGGDVRYGLKACPHCGREVGEGFRIVRRPAEPRKVEHYPIARSSYKGEEAVPHRMKEFTIGFTTYTVDYDDPENFLTTRQCLTLGQETTAVTEKGLYTWVGALTLSICYLVFVFLALTSSSNNGTIIMAVFIWAILTLPVTAIYLWVLWPPKDDNPSGS